MKYDKSMFQQCQSCTSHTSRFFLLNDCSHDNINILLNILQSYATRLLKLVDSNSVSKEDVLGSDDASLGAAAAAAARSLFGRAAPVGRSSSTKATVFTLGEFDFVTKFD